MNLLYASSAEAHVPADRVERSDLRQANVVGRYYQVDPETRVLRD